MKKKLTAIFLCVALVAIAIVGASLAYFTDTKTATNTFTMGDVKIKLDETNVNDPEGDRVASNEYNVYPGAVVTKDPIVHNVGQNAAASGADTTAMFNQVKIPAAIENGQTFGTITVKAEAIQADGFDTWEAAFAAFDA